MNVGAAVGTNGFLRVVKDIGMKDYFTGSTELHNGEIAEDFTYYFATSEQVPSAVGLGVLCTLKKQRMLLVVLSFN